MTLYAVTLGLADGTCALFGTDKPTPILVEIEEPTQFVADHITAVCRAGEITGLDVSSLDSIVKRISVEPVVTVLDLKLLKAS